MLELKKAFGRFEFKVAVTIGLLFSMVCLIEGIKNSPFNIFPSSAFQTAMVYDGKIAELFSIFILPMLAVLPFVDSYYCERKYGVEICYLTRTTHARYLLTKAAVVFVSSFIAVILPYLVNQILCIIAFPLERSRDIVFANPYQQTLLIELKNAPSPVLLMNQPGMRNILHAMFAGLYGASIGVFGFSLSLFIRKSRVFANLLPIAISYVWIFFTHKVLGNNFIPVMGIGLGLNQKVDTMLPMISVVFLGYLACLFGILVKSRYKRDVL